MATTIRPTREHESVRNNILKTAQSIARQDGWQAVSIRKIADEIQYSSPIVYEYFSSKDALLAEVRALGFRYLQKQIEQLLQRYRDPEKQLVEVSVALWELGMQKPEMYQVMFNLEGAFCGIPMTQCHDVQQFSETINRVLFSFIPKSKESIRRLFFEWWATAHGFISLAYTLRPQYPADQTENLYRETMHRFARNLH